MTLVIRILVETAPRALKTIITPEIIIARVQEDTRAKTVTTMSVSESIEVYGQIIQLYELMRFYLHEGCSDLQLGRTTGNNMFIIGFWYQRNADYVGKQIQTTSYFYL